MGQDMIRVTDDAAAAAPPPSAPEAPAATPAQSLDAALDAAFSNVPAATPAPAPAATPAATEVAPVAAATPPAEVATLATPVPEAETLSAPTPSLAETHFAPLFELSKLSLDEATPQAANLLKNLYGYDPNAYSALVNGVYETAKGDLRSWVLTDLGIGQEKIDQFVTWLQAGGGELQAPSYFPPFPTPDTDGLVTLPGLGEINTNDPLSKRLYENEKFRYETDANNHKIEFERQAAERQTAEKQAADEKAAAQRVSSR